MDICGVHAGVYPLDQLKLITKEEFRDLKVRIKSLFPVKTPTLRFLLDIEQRSILGAHNLFDSVDVFDVFSTQRHQQHARRRASVEIFCSFKSKLR